MSSYALYWQPFLKISHWNISTELSIAKNHEKHKTKSKLFHHLDINHTNAHLRSSKTVKPTTNYTYSYPQKKNNIYQLTTFLSSFAFDKWNTFHWVFIQDIFILFLFIPQNDIMCYTCKDWYESNPTWFWAILCLMNVMLLPKGQGFKLSKIHPSFSFSPTFFFSFYVPIWFPLVYGTF